MNADVAGYSRMMARNELGTVTLWLECVNLICSLVKECGGSVLDTVGDNVSAEFRREEDALRCALKIQSTLRAYNKNIGASESIRLRIGLHTGDVLDAGGRLYGDVVNIAARLQSFAEPEEVMISGALAERLGPRWASSLTDLGAHAFKNIPHRVQALAVRAGH
jgi:adenylate cyclase